MKTWILGLGLALAALALALGWALDSQDITPASAQPEQPKEQAGGTTHAGGAPLPEVAKKRTWRPSPRPEPNLVAEVRALRIDESELRRRSGEMVGCDDCVSRLIPILLDPTASLEQRLAAAELLAASGTFEGTRALLQALLDAGAARDDPAVEGILHVLANLDSPQAAAALVDFLSGDLEGLDITVPLVPFIHKVLTSMSAESQVGTLLIEAFRRTASAEVRARLEAFKHPQLEAVRLIEAWQLGNREAAEQSLERLLGNQTPAALEGLILLAREAAVPLESLNSIAFDWARDSGPQVYDTLLEHLTRFDASAAERSMAAHGLAGLGPDAESALRKALAYETDPVVSEQLESAISTLHEEKP